MSDIVLATNNPGKIREFGQMAKEHGINLLPMPAGLDPEETGSTFMENAIIKASAAAAVSGLPAVGDDSGLEVDALGGRPGIHSARYCEGNDGDRRVKLLAELKDVAAEARGGAFVCAMAMCSPDGTVLHKTEKRWYGRIAFEERGVNGFGFDPIFLLLDRDETSAEITNEEKNILSHRGQAWRQMLDYIRIGTTSS